MLGLISEIENPKSLDLYSKDTMLYDKSKRNIINDSEIKSRIDNLSYGNELNQAELIQSKEIIFKNKKAFKWSEDEIGTTNLCEHVINTTNSNPIKQNQYRQPY